MSTMGGTNNWGYMKLLTQPTPVETNISKMGVNMEIYCYFREA